MNFAEIRNTFYGGVKGIRATKYRSYFILFLLYVLMFWSDLPAYRPGMDSMTYGALAKHILETGDWAVPHYTTQAYPNFFQHPPLALWMMAATMKIFGTTEDWVLKVLPAAMAALCALGVYLWGRRIRGESFAFLATLILLTSTRFAKYSKGFMLDPFLATFSLWAVFLAVIARKDPKRSWWLSILSGLLIAAAMLSKGLFAFAPLAVILLIFGADIVRTGHGRGRALLFLLGLLTPLALWFAIGGAPNYLAHYYSEHVAERIGPHPFIDHLAPLINLGKVYWPWLPFFLVGAWKLAKSFRDETKRDELAIALTAAAFIGGFCLVASFLEQYHTATYPFAALVAAAGIPAGWEKYRVQTERVLLVIAAGFVIYLAANPYSMQGTEYKNPIRIGLKDAREYCLDPGIKRIAISTGVAEIWYALAMGSWNTDWDPHSGPPSESPETSGSQLLLAGPSDILGSGWYPTGHVHAGLAIYRSVGVKCE
jgi:4-amino-4-deoxy-L-arabinose transferase-like glycosyltransferase